MSQLQLTSCFITRHMQIRAYRTRHTTELKVYPKYSFAFVYVWINSLCCIIQNILKRLFIYLISLTGQIQKLLPENIGSVSYVQYLTLFLLSI